MSYFGRNLKKIRKVKMLSQAEFARIFDITRASIGSYEEERAEPKIDVILTIAKYFSISLDALLTKELTVYDITHFDSFKHLQANGHQVLSAKLVKAERQAEYVQLGVTDNWADSLPDFAVATQKLIRAFEFVGGAMSYLNQGIRNGDVVVASALAEVSAAKIQQGQVYVVVADGVYICRCYTKDEFLVLQPDNPDYKRRKLLFKNIKELWLVRGVYTDKLNHPVAVLEARLRAMETAISALQ